MNDGPIGPMLPRKRAPPAQIRPARAPPTRWMSTSVGTPNPYEGQGSTAPMTALTWRTLPGWARLRRTQAVTVRGTGPPGAIPRALASPTLRKAGT